MSMDRAQNFISPPKLVSWSICLCEISVRSVIFHCQAGPCLPKGLKILVKPYTNCGIAVHSVIFHCQAGSCLPKGFEDLGIAVD